MKRNLGLLIVAVLMSQGCATNNNVSKEDPFAAYVGKDVVLVRDAEIWRAPNKVWYTHRRNVLYEPGDTDANRIADLFNSQPLVRLSPGDTVHIERAIYHDPNPWLLWDSIGLHGVHALGTFFTSAGETLKFEYRWTDFPDRLHRAPWEGEDVPVSRDFDIGE